MNAAYRYWPTGSAAAAAVMSASGAGAANGYHVSDDLSVPPAEGDVSVRRRQRSLVMSYRVQWLTTVITLALACRWSGAAEAPVPSADLRASVARALPPLTRGAAGHRENKSCFACHSQGLPIMAMTTARSRGVAIDSDELKAQLKSIADFLGENRAGYLEGKG